MNYWTSARRARCVTEYTMFIKRIPHVYYLAREKMIEHLGTNERDGCVVLLLLCIYSFFFFFIYLFLFCVLLLCLLLFSRAPLYSSAAYYGLYVCSWFFVNVVLCYCFIFVCVFFFVGWAFSILIHHFCLVIPIYFIILFFFSNI